MWPHESINTKATSLWILAARNTRILNLILVAISLGYKCSLKHSQKITVVNTNCDNNWCKMGLLFVLHWKQSGFHPAVCGFFWDLCSSFCIYYKFIPIKAFFFWDWEHQKGRGETWVIALACHKEHKPGFITIHRTICFANTLTWDSLQEAGLSQRNN